MLNFGAIVGPDGKGYLTLAENLLRHACYSDDNPVSGTCTPTWSYQPPGYPAFLAVVMAVFGKSAAAVIVVQSLLFGVAVFFLLESAVRLQFKLAGVVAAGLLIALSPNTLGWSNWVMTEPLAAAGLIWLVAEFLTAIATRRIPILRFSAAIAVCAILRWDTVWASIPLIVLAFRLYRLKKAALTVAIIGVLSALPYAALSIRAASAGLPLVPSAYPPKDEVPTGILTFWRTAAVTETSASNLFWPVWGRRYRDIQPARYSESFAASALSGHARELFRQLASTPDRATVPTQLDASFADLARRYPSGDAWYYPRLILARMYHSLRDPDPINSMGFRISPSVERTLSVLAAAERVLLPVVCFFLFFLTRNPTAKLVIGSILLLILMRTLFLAGMTELEQRYWATTMPLLEFATGAFLWAGAGEHRFPAAQASASQTESGSKI
jgi:hypothetical protein